MAQALRKIEKAAFTHPNAVSLTQSRLLGSGANVKIAYKEDSDDCVDPSNMLIEQIECNCWAHSRSKCESKGDDESQEKCWRNLICTHEGVCQSWQSANCAAEERSPTFIQDKDKADDANSSLVERVRLMRPTDIDPTSLDQTLEESLTLKRACR